MVYYLFRCPSNILLGKNSSEKVVEAVGSLKLSSSNDDDADADDVASIEKINSLVVPESKVRSDQEGQLWNVTLDNSHTNRLHFSSSEGHTSCKIPP